MMQKLPARIVAALLLLVFIPKAGLELWLHHFLHETPAAAQVRPVASVRGDHARLQQEPLHCSCLDDTLMPLIGSGVYAYEAPAQSAIALVRTGDVSAASRDPFFSALRGPPADLAFLPL